MLRYVVVFALVLACALGKDEKEDTAASAAMTGDQFQQGVSKHDQVLKKTDKECDKLDEKDIRYLLYTREKPYGERIICESCDAKNISNSAMNVKKTLKVLIHSWSQNIENWVLPVVEDYLYSQNVDVLVVDWSVYAENCNIHSSSVYVTPFVGNSLANVLREIIGLGQLGERIHMVGFSLGAHIAGIAGRSMAPHLPGRISGLDPLRLDVFDQPGSGKLTGSDARFVDVIITSMPGLSFEYETGDITFYPNGGFSKYQGRCEDKEDDMEKLICSHSLSYKLFAESLVSPHKFPAPRCESYTKFLAGKCNGKHLAHMGEYVEFDARGKHYLEVNRDYPYDKGYDLPSPVNM